MDKNKDKRKIKAERKTRLSYKAGLYILVSCGYLLMALGAVLCFYFGTYLGKSRTYIENTFYEDAISKYSLAALTEDPSLEYREPNFRYAVIKGIGKKDFLNAAENGKALSKKAKTVDRNLSSKEETYLKQYFQGKADKKGRVTVLEYTWSDDYYYHLSFDRSFLPWPLDLGRQGISNSEYASASEDGAKADTSDEYIVVSYVPDPLSDYDDLFHRISSGVTEAAALSIAGILSLAAGIICFITGTVFFMIAAGHTKAPAFPEKEDHFRKINEDDYIERRYFAHIPLDFGTLLYLILSAAVYVIASWLVYELNGTILRMIGLIVGVYLMIPLTAAYLYSLTVNIKLGEAWKNTVIYRLMLKTRQETEKWRASESERKEVSDLNRRFEIIFFSDVAANLLIIIIAAAGARGMGMWFGIVIAFLIFYAKELYKHARLGKLVSGFALLKASAKGIASGNVTHKAKTDDLPVDLKQVADDLNSISRSIDTAVDERMKSERMQTELITNVSHDIRTPLTSIINYTDLLSKPDVTDDQKKEYLGILQKQSGKLKKLINDLIEASRADSGKMDVHPEKINAGTLINMMAGEYEEKMKERQIALETSGTENDDMLFADPNLLGRVFQNLFSNMLKYAQPGTRAYVDLEEDEDHTHLEIVFRNISAERLHITADELTKRFVRGDISRTTEGSGLGLSIAKSLTELMDGTFDLTIDGDLFKVRLVFNRVE